MEFIAMDLIGEFHPASSKGNRYALTAICMLTGFTFCIPLKSKHAEDVIKAHIYHICCPFGPSRKILTDNGTEFKNKLWTDVFDKLKTEQKFTPIYSPQCNGRKEGFHKFLKATIAKELENRVEWDDLVWKATAAYNFFPTESSGIAPFFLMLRHEAAVKHTLLESERSKYLGMDDGMINIELMSKLYLVIAHNLNEARKARDRKRKEKNTKEPTKLKIGDNVLVRDHTSKTFQPKYKDFCIIGFLGKNQKVCQLYEEEQVDKCRDGRKAIPENQMPDLGWDIAETQLQIPDDAEKPQESTEHETASISVPLQTIITIVVLIATMLQHTKSYIQGFTSKTAQAVKSTTTQISHNNLIQGIRKTYKSAALAIMIVTRTTDHTNHMEQHKTTNRNQGNFPGMQKLNDQYERSYQSHSTTYNDNYD